MSEDNRDVVVMFLSEGSREDIVAQLRLLSAQIERGEYVEESREFPCVTIRRSGCTTSGEEPMAGRSYGVIHCEGDGEPIAMFSRKSTAEEFSRGEKIELGSNCDFTVSRIDVGASVWNSYDADPRDEVARP